jgi:hypothetical protein
MARRNLTLQADKTACTGEMKGRTLAGGAGVRVTALVKTAGLARRPRASPRGLTLCEPAAAGHRPDHPPGRPAHQSWRRWLTTGRRQIERPRAVRLLRQAAAAAVLQSDLEQPAARGAARPDRLLDPAPLYPDRHLTAAE